VPITYQSYIDTGWSWKIPTPIPPSLPPYIATAYAGMSSLMYFKALTIMQIMAINSYNVNVINANVGINANNTIYVKPISYAISLRRY
jgi:hypothetical protein